MTYASITQRREAREAVSHPGKFEGESPITPILYEMALDGECDEETGDSCDGPAYVWRIGRYLLEESTYGFVSSRAFDSVEEAHERFARFEEEFYASAEEEEEEEEPETGPCDSCALLMINGVRCHETGCPRVRR